MEKKDLTTNSVISSKEEKKENSLFFKILSKEEKKLKIFLWGNWGVGKTTLAMKFPKPIMIDMDGGSRHYTKFGVPTLVSSNLVQIKKSIAYILENIENKDNKEIFGRETLILDPISEYYAILQKWWSDIFLARCPDAKQNKGEFFEFGPREHRTVKEDLRNLFRKLLDIPMHLVVTARESIKYKDSGFMIKDGLKPEIDSSIPYLFDIVLYCYKEGSKHYAIAEKDRNGFLPTEPFLLDYSYFENFLKGRKNEN